MFFSTAPPTTNFYPLSLHDALPISLATAELRRRAGVIEPGLEGHGHFDVAARAVHAPVNLRPPFARRADRHEIGHLQDRKSTRLNSSHTVISYAVFCLKKKKKPRNI